MESHRHCAFKISVVKELSRLYDDDNNVRFYVAIYSPLSTEQTHCALSHAFLNERLSLLFCYFLKRVLNDSRPKWCTRLQMFGCNMVGAT